MNKIISKFFAILCLSGISFTNVSCEKNNEEVEKPTVTVIMGSQGKGHNDYSSLIYKEIAKWENNPEINMIVHYPTSQKEAKEIYKAWAETSRNDTKALMIPANGEYAYMVATTDLKLEENQQVLAFEMDIEHPFKGVHTFEICHNGVSFLSGKLASKCENAMVIIGHKTPMLEKAADDFHAGFGADRPMDIIELSEQFKGFNMPEKAKEIAKQNRDKFILPLAGRSNDGVYEFLNECDDKDLILASGMDLDCNDKSNRIPFSYMIHIDKAIGLHIQSWLDGRQWPDYALGLESGITEVRINPNFTNVGNISKRDLEKLYQDNLELAKAKDIR